MDHIDEELFEKRDKELSAASVALNLKYLPQESLHARKYFSLLVTHAQAEATQKTNCRSPHVISKAFNICKAARKDLDKVPVLEPW